MLFCTDEVVCSAAIHKCTGKVVYSVAILCTGKVVCSAAISSWEGNDCVWQRIENLFIELILIIHVFYF